MWDRIKRFYTLSRNEKIGAVVIFIWAEIMIFFDFGWWGIVGGVFPGIPISYILIIPVRRVFQWLDRIGPSRLEKRVDLEREKLRELQKRARI